MSSPDMQALTPRRIIIIDDNPDIHKDFATILAAKADRSRLESLECELFGYGQSEQMWEGPRYDLDFASQGRQGVEKIKSATSQKMPYQLAFVDMRMPPGWDGLKTIKEIWRIDPAIQVVLCTAYSDYSWEEINQTLGMTDNLLILKKPFDSSEVAQMASTLTQKWLLAQKAMLKRAELERRVALRTRELSDSNRKLRKEMAERKALEDQLVRSQKMEAIGTLAAGVAHDLNNILSGVLSYPDLLLEQVRQDDPMYRPLSVIRQSGRKAAAIVQDMLTLARRQVAVKEPLDLSAVVNDVIESPEYGAICDAHPNIDIEIQLGSDLLPVSGSAVHLEKMVINLISNAAESMADGGAILVGLGRERLAHTLPGYRSVKPGDYVKLTVVDQGSGISREDLQHIFEPFFTKKKLGRSGTGLGMTVIWDTVNHHDGYIEVDSQQNQGTTIAIYLPKADQEVPKAESAMIEEDLTGRGERILVVDDVAEQREIATAIFQRLGYRVDAVPSGESALAYLKKQPVDLLLLDMIMEPGMDGLDTFKRVLSIYPEQKAVIASGYTKNDRVRSALELGASFVHKPYCLEEIARAVKNKLAGHHHDDTAAVATSV
ncbi:MAG: response regulator [Desulfobacteraceae bacterium]